MNVLVPSALPGQRLGWWLDVRLAKETTVEKEWRVTAKGRCGERGQM